MSNNTLEFPAASPLCTLKERVGLTDIEVVYCRPGVKGRAVFGTLVTFGKPWRTGANAPTRVKFSTAVKLNGHEVPAGDYVLMTIPEKDEWTVIVNKAPAPTAPGMFKYDEALDVVRFKVKTVQLHDTVNTFTIDFDDVTDEAAAMNISWEKTRVSIKLEVSYVHDLLPKVEAVMNSSEANKPYFQAGLLFFNHNHDLPKALKWVETAITEREIYPFVFVKAKILHKMGDKQGATTATKHALELAQKADDRGFSKQIEDFSSSLN